MAKKKLINLDKGVHTTPVRWKLDMDYIEQLKSKARNGDVEAYRALEFMDSYMAAELDNDFQKLEKKVKVPKNLKKEMTDARNSSRRDLYSLKTSYYPEQTNELENIVNENPSLGELQEDASFAAKQKTREGHKRYYAELKKSKKIG